MSTSQNTWGDLSVPGIKSQSGSPQETGGDANPTPNAASGSWDSVNVRKADKAGWGSPNAEAPTCKSY